jgi:hypothetical protein
VDPWQNEIASVPDSPAIATARPGYVFGERELLSITKLGLSRICTAPEEHASEGMREAARQALDRLEGQARLPGGQRVIHPRTLEHGTMGNISYSPTRGIWTAEILYDGDMRLSSVPLSQVVPEYPETTTTAKKKETRS